MNNQEFNHNAIICKKCGNEIKKPNINFCPNCGTDICSNTKSSKKASIISLILLILSSINAVIIVPYLVPPLLIGSLIVYSAPYNDINTFHGYMLFAHLIGYALASIVGVIVLFKNMLNNGKNLKKCILIIAISFCIGFIPATIKLIFGR